MDDPTNTAGPAAYRVKVQSVQRALKILKLFKEHEELGVTQTARLLGLSKGTVHGLMQTMKAEGFLEKNRENQRYRCGIETFKLGLSLALRMDLRRIAAERARQLCEEVGETVHLAVMLEGKCVNVERSNPRRLFMLIPQVGTILPAHCTATGKVLLASLSEEQLQSTVEKVGLQSYTPYTITDFAELQRQLEEVRRRGYAISNQEALMGLSCMAAPIHDRTGQVAAALSVAGSIESLMQEGRREEIIKAMVRAARDISLRLGYDE